MMPFAPNTYLISLEPLYFNGFSRNEAFFELSDYLCTLSVILIAHKKQSCSKQDCGSV